MTRPAGLVAVVLLGLAFAALDWFVSQPGKGPEGT